MKKTLLILTMMTLIFVGCKKDDVIEASKVMVGDVAMERGWDYVKMTAEYSYPTVLKNIMLYLSEKEDMSGAMMYECVIEGKMLSVVADGLKEGTRYYYLFEFDDGYEVKKSEKADVTTKSQPVVVTNDVSDIAFTTATLSGSITNNDKENTIISMGFCWDINPNPTTDDESVSKGNSSGVGTFTFTHNLENLIENTTYHVRAYAVTQLGTVYGENKNFKTKLGHGTVNGYEYADLGLSVKWAACNVGASSPEDYGNYYAWGETETAPNNNYSESNCSAYGLTISQLQSSGYIDGDGNLMPLHDAATANWGHTWRMPTKTEQQELLDNCEWEWTQVNGVNGYKVTGPNGNSIFLPAAGYRYGSSLYNAGEYGFYWSSTPYESNSNSAYYLYFNSSSQGVNWGRRYSGRSVRPVTE